MSLVDALIPLIAGLLMVARPQMFFKNVGSDDEIGAKRRRIKAIGYALLGVAALYSVIAFVESR